MADELQRLVDLEAIRALKVRYARYADDSYDADGLASLFTEDGVWDSGKLFGRAEGREGIRAHFSNATSRVTWALHYVLCPEITIAPDGQTAEGTWYLWQPCTAVRRGVPTPSFLAGTYHETYAKVDGRWYFRTLELDARWLEAPPATLP
jgi:hypothetical protein